MTGALVYYYGCWGELGHYLWLPGRHGYPSRVREGRELLLGVSRLSAGGPTKGEIPWGYALDGGLLKGRQLRQGAAVVEQKDGWTALSFWDSSVDSRPGSCSTFAIDALLSPAEALERARAAFPPVFARLPFEVVLV